jgi:hypothetical protein
MKTGLSAAEIAELKAQGYTVEVAADMGPIRYRWRHREGASQRDVMDRHRTVVPKLRHGLIVKTTRSGTMTTRPSLTGSISDNQVRKMLTENQIKALAEAIINALPKGQELHAMTIDTRVGFGDTDAKPVRAFVLAETAEDFERFQHRRPCQRLGDRGQRQERVTISDNCFRIDFPRKQDDEENDFAACVGERDKDGIGGVRGCPACCTRFGGRPAGNLGFRPFAGCARRNVPGWKRRHPWRADHLR